jgi:hypothetical protein
MMISISGARRPTQAHPGREIPFLRAFHAKHVFFNAFAGTKSLSSQLKLARSQNQEYRKNHERIASSWALPRRGRFAPAWNSITIPPGRVIRACSQS